MTRVNVQRWQEHISVQAASGLTVAQYAQKHGLSKYTLYAARRQVAALKAKKEEGQVVAALAKRSPFITVRVAANPVALRACLPKGVTLTLPGSLISTRDVAAHFTKKGKVHHHETQSQSTARRS